METEQFFESRKVENPLERLRKGLELNSRLGFIGNFFSGSDLSREAAAAGIHILDLHRHGHPGDEDRREKARQALRNVFTPVLWQEEKYFRLLQYFFGEETAGYVRHAWENLHENIYQAGYLRRSFRAPHRKDQVLGIQLRFIESITAPLQSFALSGEWSCYDLDLYEQIRFDYIIPGGPHQFQIWAAAIDCGNEKVFQLLRDSIYNKDGAGKVTRNIIKALLFSKREECWRLVESLLLAAQRQEGLRQTILESLDETHAESLKFMIRVITDHNLVRFSSVVRAIDTWTGLGFDAKKGASVKKVLELAKLNFDHPENIAAEINSLNNVHVYMALWCLGVKDVEDTLPYLDALFAGGTVEKKRVALLFINEVDIPDLELVYYTEAVRCGDPALLAFTLPWLGNILQANAKKEETLVLKKYPALFDHLCRLVETAPVKEIKYDGSPFEWTRAAYKKEDIFRCLFYLIGESTPRLDTVLKWFERFSVDLRKETARFIFKDHFAHRYSDKSAFKDLPEVTPFQKEFAVRCLNDKSDEVVFSAFFVLRHAPVDDHVLEVLFELLAKKNSRTRQQAEELILLQKEAIVHPFIGRLIETGAEEQRLAGLDMILTLKNEKKVNLQKVGEWVKKVSDNPRVSDAELKFISNLHPSEDLILSKENGYTFYDPALISPFRLPAVKQNGVYKRLTKDSPLGLSQPLDYILKALAGLSAIYRQHLDFEYEVSHWNNTRELILLGNEYRSARYVSHGEDLNEAHFETFPLHHVWEKWFSDWGLKPADLFLLTFAGFCYDKRFSDFLGRYVFYYHDIVTESPGKGWTRWDNPLYKILTSLMYKFPFPEKTEFLLELITVVYSQLPEKIKKFRGSDQMHSSHNGGDGWQAQFDFKALDQQVNPLRLSGEQITDYWMICRWRQYNGLLHNIEKTHPAFYLYCKAFESRLIGEDEMYCAILQVENLRSLTVNTALKSNAHIKEEFGFIKPMLEKVQNKLLDVEIKRGELNTGTSHFVQAFQSVFGVRRLIQFIKALDKTNLYKGYLYSWSSAGFSKQQTFSYLIKRTYPLAADTQAEFERLLKQAGIADEKLIQVAIYAPQWQRYISEYLGWEGLDSAIWWMHAHSKPGGYQEVNAEAESEISRYSSIDLQDFKEGVVDRNWFLSSYEKLGEKRWKLLYNSAKYITDGNGHRRIKLYYEAILEKLQYDEVVEKISAKRDQDYLRLYGLLSLAPDNPQSDVLRRYNLINQFKKESRQFGSMKQSSEAAAVRVAFENLSRNAGYEDPVRLTWAMETEQVREILEDAVSCTVDDVTVSLEIADDGRAELTVTKAGKPLKSMPAPLKKHPDVLTLTAHRKVLREQWARSKKSLEEAMVRGDEFSAEELTRLFHHPVVSGHLLKLLFVADDGRVGFIDGYFKPPGEKLALASFGHFRIAHGYDIHASGHWAYFQRYCFENKLKQPFRQVFRELYTPTREELQEKSISRRYAGHQVHPRQTSALLRSRGWKLDYETGLQKGFHKEGFMVKLYALANWFTPSDVESPTLETVEFHALKGGENVAIESINPRLFSEIMRDIDLVVSVAHVGLVDPEASQSSIEMRRVILAETLRLLKIKNTELKENHVIIAGQLGQYSVHLGSAVVHQIPGKFLNILPVHSQHRGRIFLPFMDEDPKTTEMLSKVILLAHDARIQDPTILSQISRP